LTCCSPRSSTIARASFAVLTCSGFMNSIPGYNVVRP
jgi:hypothetical protein